MTEKSNNKKADTRVRKKVTLAVCPEVFSPPALAHWLAY